MDRGDNGREEGVDEGEGVARAQLLGEAGEGAEIGEDDRDVELGVVADRGHGHVPDLGDVEQALGDEALEGGEQGELAVVQAEVVERDRGVVAEELQEVALPARQRGRGLDEDSGARVGAMAEAKHAVAAAMDPLLALHGEADVLPRLRRELLARRLPLDLREAPSPGEDRRLGFGDAEERAVGLDEHRAPTGPQEGRDLEEQAAEEALKGGPLEEGRGGVDHPLEALLLRVDDAEITVGSDPAENRRHQPASGQLRLRPVVVDVVVEHHPMLGRGPGLARAENDPDQAIAEPLADPAGELEARVLALHHHVEEDEGDVGGGAEDLSARGSGARPEELDRPSVDLEIGEREASDRVHLRLVVDDQDPPASPVGAHISDHLLVGEEEEIIVVMVGHRGGQR